MAFILFGFVFASFSFTFLYINLYRHEILG